MIVGSLRKCHPGEIGAWFTDVLQRARVEQPHQVLREASMEEWAAAYEEGGRKLPWFARSFVELNVPYFYEISTD